MVELKTKRVGNRHEKNYPKLLQREKPSRTNASLSSIVEAYLKSLSKSQVKKPENELSKLVRELKGSVKLPDDSKSYKELLQDALVKKYLG